MARARSIVRPAIVLTAVALAAACSVVESRRFDLDPPAPAEGTPCASTLGSYALPKAFLRVRIGQADAKTLPELVPNQADGKPFAIERRPDPVLSFCLDHLASPLADERIEVVKWPVKGDAKTKGSLLGAVLVNVTDQTAYIVRALIRALSIAVTGQEDFTSARAGELTPEQIVADLEFDPFDQREAAVVNDRLSKLGYCVVLEGHMFGQGADVDRYCDRPLTYGLVPTPVYRAYAAVEAVRLEPRRPGLVYRPRHPYRVAIYRKKDPHGRGRWNLEQMSTAELENLSPVLSLGITRGMFAGKRVNFVFDAGTLVTACVAKTSEVEGFVSIPLEIARSIVKIPDAVFTVQIGRLEEEAKLARLERQLFLMQQALLDAEQGRGDTRPPGSVPAAKKTPALPVFTDFADPVGLPRQSPVRDFEQLKKACEGTES